MRNRFTAPHSDSHFHTRPQTVDDRHETIDREPSEVGIANAREKSAAAIPVRLCAARTLRASRSSTLMISATRMALNCWASAFSRPRSRKTFPLPRTTLSFWLFIATSRLSLRTKTKRVAESLAAAFQTRSGRASCGTRMTCHVLTKHLIHSRLPTVTGGLEIINDLGAVAY